jgi:hypothetical protein
MARCPATFSPASPRGGCGPHSRSGRDRVGPRLARPGLIRLALLAALGVVVLSGRARYAPRTDGFYCWNEQAATATVLLAQFGSLP